MNQEPERYSFQPDSKDGETLLRWWSGLRERRGPRAELRRCRDVTDILLTSEFYHALRATGAVGRVAPERFAAVVGLLAHVESPEPRFPFAKQLARTEGTTQPPVSGLRFRRLLAISEPDQLYLPILRLLRLVGRTANIHDLSQGVYWWNERTRKTWARHYYETAPDQD
jgi:CRISPR system Cascade subunit CasB